MTEIEEIFPNESSFNGAWESPGAFKQRRHKNDPQDFISSLKEEKSSVKEDESGSMQNETDLRTEEFGLLAARAKANGLETDLHIDAGPAGSHLQPDEVQTLRIEKLGIERWRDWLQPKRMRQLSSM